MRGSAADNGLTITAYAGTTGVHLAWDADEDLRKDLLGFAIRRYGGRYLDGVWLQGGIGFPGQHHAPGQFLDTHLAPIQAFRWGDYTVYPGFEYRYAVVPMFAPWDHLRPGPAVAVTVTTESIDSPPHHVAFNRAVAASQAYSRAFDDTDPHTNVAAKRWLTRGLQELIEDFLGRAGDSGWALDVMVYEYELEDLRYALMAARARQATLRIVYHAQAGDAQTTLNQQNLAADRLDDVARARVTPNICHDKIVVLSKLENGTRSPQAVLTGSTNWTFNGLYYQANVAHAVDDPDLAANYLRMFEELYGGADQAGTRQWINENNPVESPTDGEPAVVFSPRSSRTDLTQYVDLIGGAGRSLIFITTFELDPAIESALAGEAGPRILRYGLQNSKSKVTGYDRSHARSFTATGGLRTAPAGFLDESTHGQDGNILVHGKIILLDFDTAHPVLITGSANYSYSSSNKNDENALVIHDDARLADIYLCEMFRLFDHYRFRYNWNHPDAAASGTPPPPVRAASAEGKVTPRFELDETDGWTARYYDDAADPHAMERKQLSRPLG